MSTYRFTINIQSAFGTPLVGDTLFGQICWEIVNVFGEGHLNNLLKNYDSEPFLVVSDAFPSHYLPLPTLPSFYWNSPPDTDRKVLKARKWINIEYLTTLTEEWQSLAKSEKEILQITAQEQMHNTIRRDTNSTGTDMFAPYSMSQIWYSPNTQLDIYCVVNEELINLQDIKLLFENIGKIGFGRDASIGLGRFSISNVELFKIQFKQEHNAYLTLANISPRSDKLNPEKSLYQLTTRFGRHGNIYAMTDNPFKKPIILAKTGSVFYLTEFREQYYLGNSLRKISYSQDDAVHQGYAPVIPLEINYQKLGL